MKYQTDRGQLEARIRQGLSDSMLDAVVMSSVLDNVAEAVAGKIVEHEWLIEKGSVHLIESIYGPTPCGQDKESDRWDVYTEHREGGRELL